MCHKNELLIEKIKYKIEYFEYGAAKKLVGEMEENGFEYKVKKPDSTSSYRNMSLPIGY